MNRIQSTTGRIILEKSNIKEVPNTGLTVIKKEMGYAKCIYTVRTNEFGKPLTNQEILELCDAPLGAPFGGTVVKNNDSTYTVVVYTD